MNEILQMVFVIVMFVLAMLALWTVTRRSNP